MTALRIGTRRSDLALAQAGQVRLLLQAKGIDAQLVPMTTAGDEGQPVDVTTSPAGLKGMFIDTIVSSLRDGTIDLAVHSAKDLPAEEDDDLVIGAVPERADPRDALVMRGDRPLAAGMWVGTSSIRRRAQLLAAYPGVEVAHLRGNVPTRLRKLDAGDVDAVILAAAGLDRLGIRREHARHFGVGEMVPAPGQGCLVVQCRAANRKLRAALTLLEHHAPASPWRPSERSCAGSAATAIFPWARSPPCGATRFAWRRSSPRLMDRSSLARRRRRVAPRTGGGAGRGCCSLSRAPTRSSRRCRARDPLAARGQDHPRHETGRAERAIGQAP